MLQQVNTETVPPVAEVLEVMTDYLDLLWDAEHAATLALGTTRGRVVSMTLRQALSAGEKARTALERARYALALGGNFARSVPMPGGWVRPVDLAGDALRALEVAKQWADRHCEGETTALEERDELATWRLWVTHADQDLGVMLATTVKLLGRPDA